jgi:hypothetical protein
VSSVLATERLLKEIAQLRDMVAELEEELRQLRQTLKPPLEIYGLPPMPPKQAKLLKALYTAWPAILSHERLNICLWDQEHYMPSNPNFNAKVHVCMLRRLIHPHVIESHSCLGYRLTDEAHAWLSEHIGDNT